MELIENIHNSLIFYPSREFISSPKQEGIEHEEVFINTSDGEKLHGYFFPAPAVKAGFSAEGGPTSSGKPASTKTVIYLHGNAQNVSAWYIAPVEIQKYVPVNFLLIDYRGYGKSTGKPTVEGVIIDAQAMYQYLIDKGLKSEDISVYGRSIGGAIGFELAMKEKLKSIVIQSSFTSLRKIAKELYPFIPDQLISNNYFNSIELIKKIKVPVLISHGDKDEIIPISHSYKLFEAANEPKKLIILKGATHNDISDYLTNEYYKELNKLFL